MDRLDELQIGEIDKERFNIALADLDLPEAISRPETAILSEVLMLLQEKKMGSILVVDESGKLSGIMTERDILRFLSGGGDLECEIKEAMTDGPVTYKKDHSLIEVLKVMTFREFRHVPIVDDQGKPTHIISINDLLRFVVDQFPNSVEKHGTLFEWDILQVHAQDENFNSALTQGKLTENIFMTHLRKAIRKDLIKVDVNDTLEKVFNVMLQNSCGAVVVTEYETLLKGIVTERDFLFKIFGKIDKFDRHKISEFMTPNPHTLMTRHFFAHAINNMFTCRYRNAIVVNEERYPLAIVSILDILKYISSKLFEENK